MFSWSQIIITGQVLHKYDRSAIPGVTIMEKGTPNVALSDMGGNFSISVSNQNTTLIFSFLGMIPKEITICERKYIEVELKDDCIIDWFDNQQIGLGLNSGVVNTPIGVHFNFSLPYIIKMAAVESSLDYQTNLKNNKLFFAQLNVLHPYYNCSFNFDIKTSFRQLNFDNRIYLKAYAFEPNLNFRSKKIIIGLTSIDYLNSQRNKNVQSLGLTIGYGTVLGWRKTIIVEAKTMIYKGLVEYQAAAKRDFRHLNTFIRFYKVNAFNEVSLGVNFQTTYLFKNQRRRVNGVKMEKPF